MHVIRAVLKSSIFTLKQSPFIKKTVDPYGVWASHMQTEQANTRMGSPYGYAHISHPICIRKYTRSYGLEQLFY